MLIYGKIQDSEVHYFESGLPGISEVSFKLIKKNAWHMRSHKNGLIQRNLSVKMKQASIVLTMAKVVLRVVVVREESTNHHPC
jgi:hypothetical protein